MWTIYGQIAVWILSGAGVSFLIWRKTRVDFNENDVLSLTAWLIFIGIIAGAGAERLFFGKTGIMGEAMIISWCLVIYRWCKSKVWDFWEWLDLVMPVSLVFGVLINLTPDAGKLWRSGILAGGWLLTLLINRNYRRFRWYVSGKLGFAGIFSILWWSSEEIAVAMKLPGKIYLVDLPVEQLLSIAVFTVFATALYLRSGRKTSQDLKNLWPKYKLKTIKNKKKAAE